MEQCQWTQSCITCRPKCKIGINWNFRSNFFMLISFDSCHKKILLESLTIPLALKEHNLICLPNKIRLNLINTFVMSRNKHISKKTPCFLRKRSKNKAKPNEFERRILKLSFYACLDNLKCRHAFSMFRNASSQNEFRFNLLRCMTETSSVALQ